MIHTIFSLYEPPGREVGAYFSMPFGLGLFERGGGGAYLLIKII